MKRPLENCQRAGLTLVELLLVLAVICAFCALLYPPTGRCKGNSVQVACQNNLRQLALSEIVWANDHGHDSLPAQLSTNVGGVREFVLAAQLKEYYKALSNELVSARILTCPSNRQSPTDDFANLKTNHLSYFLNADAALGTNDNAMLHGDRQIEFMPPVRGAIVRLEPDTALRWRKGIHHKQDESGNVASTDGSVQTTSNGAEVREIFQTSSQGKNRIVLP